MAIETKRAERKSVNRLSMIDRFPRKKMAKMRIGCETSYTYIYERLTKVFNLSTFILLIFFLFYAKPFAHTMSFGEVWRKPVNVCRRVTTYLLQT